MKITAITEQKKNPNRCSIFIDGKYAFSFSIDEIQDRKLRIGLEVSQAESRGGIQTPDRWSRNPVLYSAELRGHFFSLSKGN